MQGRKDAMTEWTKLQGRVTSASFRHPRYPSPRSLSIGFDRLRMTCLSTRLPCVNLIKVTLRQRKREAGSPGVSA
jgi:hypothetical protein